MSVNDPNVIIAENHEPVKSPETADTSTIVLGHYNHNIIKITPTQVLHNGITVPDTEIISRLKQVFGKPKEDFVTLSYGNPETSEYVSLSISCTGVLTINGKVIGEDLELLASAVSFFACRLHQGTKSELG